MQDLLVIRKIEEQLCVVLKEIDDFILMFVIGNSYVLKNDHVVGLSIKRHALPDIDCFQLMGILGELKQLTSLALFNTPITDIGPLVGLTQLTNLSLYDNQITDASPFGELTQLTELSLSKNQITDVSPLGEQTQLTKLYLYTNQITDISPLGELTQLTELGLGRNQITDIGTLGALTQLVRLDLYHNQITDISPLGALTQLARVDLRYNRVGDLPSTVVENYQSIIMEDKVFFIEGINLFGNPLVNPPIETVTQGKGAVLRYLERRETQAYQG